MDLRVQAVHVLQGLLDLRDGSGGAELHNELAHFNIARTLVMDLLEQALDLLKSLLKLSMVGAELRCTMNRPSSTSFANAQVASVP